MYDSVTDLHDSLLLRLPGITGTAKQSGHVGEIEVTGVDFQRPLTNGTSSGKLTIVKRTDKANGALYQAAAKNTTFAEAVLTRLTLSNKEVEQLRFKDLVLRRVEAIGAIRGDQEPVLRLDFDFASAEVKQVAGLPPTAGLPPSVYGPRRTI
jgi:type VI protein secretion system component Hcp